MVNLSDMLEPIAAWFRGLGLPEPIVHWGHPLMMGIVALVMGSAVGYAGWKGRLTQDGDVAQKSLKAHKRIVLWMFTFMAAGYTGGLLSLVMQKQPVLESPHFWTGTLVLALLAVNGAISITKFGGGQASLRTAHAYLGTVTLGIVLIHAVLGLKLGLSI